MHGPVVRSSVYVGAYGYGYPYYSPWFGYGFGYGWGPYRYPYFYPPYGYYGYYGYGYAYPDQVTASIRLDVSPTDTEVFVDGYAAGRVDNFDGVFQRLRLRPGAHEVVLYLAGHRTVRQQLYLNPGSDQKVRYTMEPLGPGEIAEPPPQPTEPPSEDELRNPSVPVEPRAEEPQPRDPAAGEPSSGFGTLAVRVQPRDAEILIDGERWSAPAEQDRLIVRLAEGRHRVEVQKAGFDRYTEDVLIRRDSTLALNVSLLRGAEGR